MNGASELNPTIGEIWPPPYESMVAAPAGEPATRRWVSVDQLEWMHKALQVIFMGLALIGLCVVLAGQGPRFVLRGAARKHAIS